MAPWDSVHLPVGFKFHPTESDLLGFYLHNKAHGVPFKDEILMPDFNLYGDTEPWAVWDRFGGDSLEEGEDLYFFTTHPRRLCFPAGRGILRSPAKSEGKGTTNLLVIMKDRNGNNCLLLGIDSKSTYKVHKSERRGGHKWDKEGFWDDATKFHEVTDHIIATSCGKAAGCVQIWKGMDASARSNKPLHKIALAGYKVALKIEDHSSCEVLVCGLETELSGNIFKASIAKLYRIPAENLTDVQTSSESPAPQFATC